MIAHQPRYRPPSEARSFILQATLGCSWNRCTYCAMYRDQPFAVRPLEQSLSILDQAAARWDVDKLFVADGDALVMGMGHWRAILRRARERWPRLRQVSCYATAQAVLDKSPVELAELRSLGLSLLYVGPESGDEAVLRRIAKGPRPQGVSRDTPYLFDAHVAAAARAHDAGMRISTIFLLGAGGVARSAEHAAGSARLITAMDPEYLAALTLTIVPGTPLDRLRRRGAFELPDPDGLLGELRVMVDESRPSNALFRTNHASNYLPLAGRLPGERGRIVELIDMARAGELPLRPEFVRGL